jgi:hypothetical protein
MNYKWLAILIGIALLLICAEGVIIHYAKAEENGSYVEVSEIFENKTLNITKSNITYSPYIVQGDVVYTNATYDISGFVPPYPQLAYWDGYDMYDSSPSYNITLPDNKKGYYHFYIDPVIFGNRTGKWYKYDGTFESNSYNLAFIVSPIIFSNYTLTYPNGTSLDISTEIIGNFIEKNIPTPPPVPIKHVSDFLVARGDSFNITVNESTNLWLFGREDVLLDHASFNKSIDVSEDVLSHFEPGAYTLALQTIGPDISSFTVRYDNVSNELKWFNSNDFKVYSESLDGFSGQVIKERFSKISGDSHDNFTFYNLVLQDPSIEITQIEEKLTPNQTKNEAGEIEYFTNASFIDVRGYTNVMPLTPLRFVLDEKEQTPRTIKSHTTTIVTEGTYGGDMRYYKAIIPIDMYGLPVGPHTVTAYTNYSKSGTVVTFYVYEAPAGNVVPKDVVRYVGGNEFVPTPTPEIQVVREVETIVKVQTKEIVVEVTPSQEQVSKAWFDGALAIAGILVGLILLSVFVIYIVAAIYRGYVKRD